MNTGAQEVLYSISLPNPCMRSVGICIQPKRQPVINQDLEKLFTEMTRSSLSLISKKEGAHCNAEVLVA